MKFRENISYNGLILGRTYKHIYSNTDFRILVRPKASTKDSFNWSPDDSPNWQGEKFKLLVFAERVSDGKKVWSTGKYFKKTIS
jgi:hypothetical protein